jgi:tight adherence protein C
VIAAMVSVSVFLLVIALKPRLVTVDRYLGSPGRTRTRRFRLPSPGSAVAGAVVGAVTGLAIDQTKTVALGIVGALGGALVNRAVRSTARERRASRLAHELPTVADTIALHVLAGESVSTAIARFTAVGRGVASDELNAVLAAGIGLEESLRKAARETVHPEAARLYDLLGHAHRTGGGLADALTALAADFRASLARDLTAEGGRRALTTYGPILALMVPVTLLFLMYPTLAGLNALSSTP